MWWPLRWYPLRKSSRWRAERVQRGNHSDAITFALVAVAACRVATVGSPGTVGLFGCST